MNKVDRKYVQQVSKWWFHFYNLTDEYKRKELTLESKKSDCTKFYLSVNLNELN